MIDILKVIQEDP